MARQGTKAGAKFNKRRQSCTKTKREITKLKRKAAGAKEKHERQLQLVSGARTGKTKRRLMRRLGLKAIAGPGKAVAEAGSAAMDAEATASKGPDVATGAQVAS